MYLDFLKDWDAGYSWGSAGLAYLYHSRTEDTSGMCGCVWGLSFGCESEYRWGVRRSCASVNGLTMVKMTKMIDTRPSHTLRIVVGVYTGTSKALYKVFTNELDALTAFKVNWRPYNERAWGFELNVMCRQDRLLWRCIVPMIYVYAVEYHLPQCVATHFGRVQRTPPGGLIDTGGSDLHLSAFFSISVFLF